MAALVLGLLIASANTFYNSQKGDLEILSGRVVELDSILREYGPYEQPIRELLKGTVTRVYQNTWNSPAPQKGWRRSWKCEQPGVQSAAGSTNFDQRLIRRSRYSRKPPIS